MKKIKFVNGSQPAINDTNLNLMQDNIEEAINNAETTVTDNLTSDSATDALSANQGKILNDKISNANTYSSQEINVGKKWIDGKEIYRKVLTGTKTSEDLILNVASNIETMNVISAKLDGPGHYLLPFFESSEVFCRVELDGNNIKIKSGTSAYAQGTVTLIVEYTKQEA